VNLIDAYRYLAALHTHRHFGRAAAACHVTQPALSNALRTLESHFGCTIVRRGRQFEGFTAEGERVLAAAHRMLREQEALEQEVASGRGDTRGRLVIGTVPTALPIAARFAARLAQRHPGLAPQLRSMSSQDIESGLDSLAVDLALGFTDRVNGRSTVAVWPQTLERYFLVGPAGASATAIPGATVTWTEAAGMRLALLTPEMHHRVLIDRVFEGLGLQVRPVLETDAVLALSLAVASGGLAAVMPGALVASGVRQAGVPVRRLVEPELLTPVGFMTSADARPTRALEAALELACEAAWLAEVRTFSGALDHCS
jgi:DNA-binding transcriptional LysR family regulator